MLFLVKGTLGSPESVQFSSQYQKSCLQLQEGKAAKDGERTLPSERGQRKSTAALAEVPNSRGRENVHGSCESTVAKGILAFSTAWS